MRIKKLQENRNLVKTVTGYRIKKQKAFQNTNEKCENYYRVNDAPEDGRGDF